MQSVKMHKSGIDARNRVKLFFLHSMFSRAIIAFLLITLPFFTISFTLYLSSLNALKQEISSSAASQANYFFSKLQDEFDRIERTQYDYLFNNSDLNKLAIIANAMTDLEKGKALLRVMDYLLLIKNSSIYIKEVYVYIPSINRIASAVGGVMEATEQNIASILNIGEDSKISLFDYSEKSIFLRMAFPIKNETRRLDSSYFIIGIELSTEKIQDELNRFTEDSGGAFLLYGDGLSIATDSRANVPDSIILDRVQKESGLRTSNMLTIKGDKKNYLVVYKKSDRFDMVFARFIEEKSVYSRLDWYRIWIVAMIASSLSIIAGFAYYLYKFMHKPLKKLAGAFGSLSEGKLDVAIKHDLHDEFQYIYQRFNEMVQRLNHLVNQVYVQKLLAERAQLKQLQSQINPHFLYNSFFTLHRMIKNEEQDSAAIFSKQLGSYFKYITRNAMDDAPLENEVEHARIYIEIQSTRFMDRIRAEFDEIPEAGRKIIVPRLILQPILENSFEHGLAEVLADGILKIGFLLQHGILQIIIDDNGKCSDGTIVELNKMLLNENTESSETTALFNIHTRLRIYFDKNSGLRFERSPIGGLRVIATIAADALKGEKLQDVQNDYRG